MRLVDFIGVLRRYQDKPSGYTIALVVLAVALGVRELLDPYIKIPYVTLFPAMVVCSLVGGRLAGILAAILGGIAAWYLWLPPPGNVWTGVADRSSHDSPLRTDVDDPPSVDTRAQ
jgi:hypothetical protein